MLIRIPKSWEIPERDATPETAYFDRRRFLARLGLGGIGATAALGLASSDTGPTPSPTPSPASALAAAGASGPASTASYPAARNPRYTLDRELTPEALSSRFNIFDEFAIPHDQVWKAAAGFRTDPWKIQIGGAIETQLAVDARDLVRRFGLEERLYRHRCVETWAMAVPWTGFPFKKLVELAKPLAAARFVRMVSVARPAEMSGWYASRRVFPYYEALSLDEATNELAFLATGIYGHELPPQHGAPLRLVVPWKYGFKSIKSIVAFQFTRERPGTFWNELAPHHYSFESNVDPAGGPEDQTHEKMLGSEESRVTQPYNGYGELVAHLYKKTAP